MAVRLIIEDLEGSTTVVNLGTEEVTIGRKPHNTIQLTEQNVSRSHAKLIFQDDGWLIHDLESYNGVKVNGVPINQPTLLRESDLIQIGDYHLTLTDDVDRATVDIGPRHAANDNNAGVGAIAMMSSSNDLPSVSVEDLEPMRPPPGPIGGYAQPAQEEDKQSKTGLIIGIVGALAAIVGIAIFLASQNGDGDKQATDGDKPKPEQKVEPTEDPKAPVNDSKEAVPEVPPADTGAPADDGGDDAGVDDGGSEIVPEIEPPDAPPEDPKPKNNGGGGSKQPKNNTPKLPPDEALKEARKAAMKGDNRKAYSLAKDAYDQNGSTDALNLMGVAACKMGSAAKAKAAYKKMSSGDKATLEKICGPLGITL